MNTIVVNIEGRQSIIFVNNISSVDVINDTGDSKKVSIRTTGGQAYPAELSEAVFCELTGISPATKKKPVRRKTKTKSEQ